MGFPGRWHPKISRDKTVFLAQKFCAKIRLRCFALWNLLKERAMFRKKKPHRGQSQSGIGADERIF